MLFQLGPHRNLALIIHLDADEIRPAAHGAVFDIFLPAALRHVDRDDDLLATRAANISGFVVHRHLIARTAANGERRPLAILLTIHDNAEVASSVEDESMANEHEYAELTEYLRGKGHTDAEIEAILVRVRQYEVETQHDSIMDSIGNGTFDLAALIKEALGEKG